MADTITFTGIVNTHWTDVSTGGAAGIISNESGNTLKYLEAANVPGGSAVGHSLAPGSSIRYAITAGQKIFMRSLNPKGVAVVTPD